MTCTICRHEKRTEIESAVVAGASLRNIAKQYAVGFSSVNRHAASHISASIMKSQAAKEEARGLDVVAQLQEINKTTQAILREAREAGQNGLALNAIDRVCKQLELQAKLLGDIDAQPQINITLIQQILYEALKPYDDARYAVAAAFMEHSELLD